MERLHQYYRLDRIGAETAAAEFGPSDVKLLAGAILGNPRLRELVSGYNCTPPAK